MPASHSDIDQSRLARFLGFRLTRAKVQVHRALTSRLAPHELSTTDFSALVLIDANPGLYQRQLGLALEISPPNVVPIIDRLVLREVVVRLPSKDDRRMQELHLTDAGRALLKKAETDVARFEQLLEESLTATEQRYIDSALKKLSAFEI